MVLSAQYTEGLPQAIVNDVNADSKRRVKMRRFDARQVQKFFELRGVVLSDEILQPVVDVSGGIPIYLEYLADQLGKMNRYERERYLESVPSLRNDTIDAYHRQLWDTCQKDEREAYILAVLAVRGEFTTPETLLELLHGLGVDSTLHAMHQNLARLRHILRVSDAESVAIRHNSLAEFLIEQTAHLRAQINQAMVVWYNQNPTAMTLGGNRLRHMWDCGRYLEILSICDDDWANRAWEHHRPAAEIQRNLNVAWRAASARRDVLEFIRVALLKQRVALVSNNLDVSDVDIARLLLHMDLPKQALRKVWDGERPQCSGPEFARFCLAYISKLGSAPPEHVVRAGLGHELDPNSRIENAQTWFQARSLMGDPVEVLAQVGQMRWEDEDVHYARRPMREEDNKRTNIGLQMAVLHTFSLHGRQTRWRRCALLKPCPKSYG